MKNKTSLSPSTRIFVCLILLFLTSVAALPQGDKATDKSPTVLILVRHAEKKIVPPENKDPDISPAGQARAEEIAHMFSESGIAAIYATQYKRTQQTVKPLADKLGLTVTHIEAKQTAELVKQIRAKNTGQVVFIAGHNNTVPEIIAAMGGPQMPIIPETEYDNLFILTIQGDSKATLVKMKYGSAVLAAGNQSMSKP